MNNGYAKAREVVLPAHSGGAYTSDQNKVLRHMESRSP